MDRQGYLKMRQTNQMDMSLFYQYYLQNHREGVRLDYGNFSSMFMIYLQANVAAVLERMDKRFNIAILMDKDGKEIRYY